jgi:hypothetical protein
MKPPPSYTVVIESHWLADRWFIPSTSSTLPAESSDAACLQAVRWAHRDAGAPPWRPLLDESLPHATAAPAKP